jgi:hypothetical protein
VVTLGFPFFTVAGIIFYMGQRFNNLNGKRLNIADNIITNINILLR